MGKVLNIDTDGMTRRAFTPEQSLLLYGHRAEVQTAERDWVRAKETASEARKAYDQAVEEMMTFIDDAYSGQTRLAFVPPAEGVEE